MNNLRKLARDKGVAIILCVNLNRDIETRKDNRPYINDLSKVIVYLVCIHGKGKTASTYHFSLADLKKNYTVGTKYSDLTDKLWLNEEIFNLGEEIHFKESKK